MARIVWPTHRSKSRQRDNEKIYRKKRGRRLRKLHAGGKRGVKVNGYA